MKKFDWFNLVKSDTVLPVILLILKLTHVIDWSWWIIFAPFWVPIALMVTNIPIVLLTMKIKKLINYKE
jgi:hypothetical protein